MAEFNILCKWLLDHNPRYHQLLQQLDSNQKECLKNTNNNIKFCERDLRDFDSYLRVYQKQVADKGSLFCKHMLEEDPERSPHEVIRECITLYGMNVEIFGENVVAKLGSLADKFSVEHL